MKIKIFSLTLILFLSCVPVYIKTIELNPYSKQVIIKTSNNRRILLKTDESHVIDSNKIIIKIQGE